MTDAYETYALTQTAVFNARIAGMVAENQARISRGEALAYTGVAFAQEIEIFEKGLERAFKASRARR